MYANRSRQINECDFPTKIRGPVVYWMSRDQRACDNWALLSAQKTALEKKVPLVVLFCFVPHFLEGTLRQYGFMLRGLEQIERQLQKHAIPFYFLSGSPDEIVPAFLKQHKACALFTDFSPLKTKRIWSDDVVRQVSIPVFEVDAHNLIPCWLLFQEPATSTNAFRLRLRAMLPLFLQGYPALRKHPYAFKGLWHTYNWEALLEVLPLDRSVKEVSWIQPGEKAAHRSLRQFLKLKTREFTSGVERTDRRGEWKWRIIPYLHFGQLSIQKTIWMVMHAHINPTFKAEFLESLITQRELADHFCHFHQQYASVQAFPDWARESLAKHRRDARPYVYTREELESALTRDDFWNRVQRELVENGRLFGFARKYWAKKILEWSSSPQIALNRALYLMEKYTLTGWDTSNYYQIARAIGGAYDAKGKKEMPIYGRVLHMRHKHKEAVRDFHTYVNKR